MLGGIGQQGDDQVLQRDDPYAQLVRFGVALKWCVDGDRQARPALQRWSCCPLLPPFSSLR